MGAEEASREGPQLPAASLRSPQDGPSSWLWGVASGGPQAGRSFKERRRLLGAGGPEEEEAGASAAPPPRLRQAQAGWAGAGPRLQKAELPVVGRQITNAPVTLCAPRAKSPLTQFWCSSWMTSQRQPWEVEVGTRRGREGGREGVNAAECGKER